MSTTTMTQPYATVSEALAQPTLHRLEPNLIAVVWRLMKMAPARAILDHAEKQGLLQPGGHIVETSSGNFGYALAILARERGYRLTVVTDKGIKSNQQRAEALGSNVEVIETADGTNIQGARLARVRELLATDPHCFWPSQYANEQNPLGYDEAARHIVAHGGVPDVLVAPVGTGGSSRGLAQYLRLLNPSLRVVGVDTHGSVTFGLPDGPRLLTGLGSSSPIEIVDHTVYDEVHWVPASAAFRNTRNLFATTGLFQGPTSGAAHLVARRTAQAHRRLRVVTVCPDDAVRYQDTVFDDRWLADQGIDPHEPVAAPIEVRAPGNVEDGWSFINWERRTLRDVQVQQPRGG
ncbi:MAG: pyridoxal-phosphate dependent enzyme [Planctomycetota bacterium]